MSGCGCIWGCDAVGTYNPGGGKSGLRAKKGGNRPLLAKPKAGDRVP